MELYIAEKPSVAADIAKALGGQVQRHDGFFTAQDAVVTFAVGHLIEQCQPEDYDPRYEDWAAEPRPMVPENWKMKPNPKTAKQLKIVGSLIKKADLIINCGDAAREGQLIIDELMMYFGYRGPAKRLWLQEMNIPAIRAAMKRMRDNREFMNLRNSALARSRCDFVLGINLTRGYTVAWQSLGNRDTLHIGRVQTPMICMVVALDLFIELFVPQDHYGLKIDLHHTNGDFAATWMPPAGAAYLSPEGLVLNKADAAQVRDAVKGQEALIVECTTTPTERSAPLTFSLGGLQKACFKAFGLSAMQTLKVAQALYEKHKLTTYPRTDFAHLPEGEHGLSSKWLDAARANLGDQWDFPGTPDYSIKSAAWNSSKIGDHHGIRPTDTRHADMSKLTDVELKVYKMIVRNFLAQFYPQYAYNATRIQAFCEGHTFKSTGAVVTNMGWKVLFGGDKAEEEGGDEDGQLPQVDVGDQCTVADVELMSKKTKPPARFNPATLLDAMENAARYVKDERVRSKIRDSGMGTPATRAGIIESAVKRGYLEEVKGGKKEKAHYISTARARLIYNVVPEQLRVPDITAYFEELLKQVEDGKLDMQKVLDYQVKFVTQQVDLLKSGEVSNRMPALKDVAPPERAKKPKKAAKGAKESASAAPAPKASNKADDVPMRCEKCGADMALRNSARGPFYGCTNYPTCRNIVNAGQDASKPAAPARTASAAQAKSAPAGNAMICPHCNKPMVLRSSSRGAFYGCTGFPACKHTADADAGTAGKSASAAAVAAATAGTGRPPPASNSHGLNF